MTLLPLFLLLMVARNKMEIYKVNSIKVLRLAEEFVAHGWNLETTNGGQTYCAPTQTKCDGDNPGSVLTTDNSGFKVCWQK